VQAVAEFFAGARAIELVLLLIALEAIGLIALWRFGRCPLQPRATLLILAPGSSLLLASHALLAGASWLWVSWLFLVALVLHLIDLRQRWQERQRQG
jgi:hypothetical protein